MNTAERREEILRILGEAETPVAARELAARFGVSRQVIVQDMAVIRVSTPGILSTTKGYAIQQENTCTREFKGAAPTGSGGRGTESDRGLRRPGKKYQHQPPGLRKDIRGDGHPFPAGCAGIHGGPCQQSFHGAEHGHLGISLSSGGSGEHTAAGSDRKRTGESRILAPLQPWEKQGRKEKD